MDAIAEPLGDNGGTHLRRHVFDQKESILDALIMGDSVWPTEN